MKKKTKEAMIKFAQTFNPTIKKPSYERASCYRIASYKLENGESIAERLERDHRSQDGALRDAHLMMQAGCAKEINKKNDIEYGTYVFEDESTLN
jgi:hypothetical protein